MTTPREILAPHTRRYMYNARVSRPYDVLKPWVEWLSLRVDKLLVVQHDADEDVARTHCHILVIGPTLALSMKNGLSRMIGKVDKGDWAFPAMKDDNYEKLATYFSKGKIDYSFMYGFDYDWTHIKSLWVEPKKTQAQLNRLGEIIKLDKMKLKEMIDRINLLLTEDNDFSIDNYLSKIRQVFVLENRLIVGRYKIRDIVDTLMAINDPTEWKISIKRFCEYRT